jgi:hypothetical protein
MSNDKMREEFEAAVKRDLAIVRFDRHLARNEGGDYVNGMAEIAWWGWKESRAALVVELPERLDYAGCTSAIEACRGAIEAAGLRVQSSPTTP